MKTYLMSAVVIAANFGGVGVAAAEGHTDVASYGRDLSTNVDQQGSNKLQATVFGPGRYNVSLCGNGRRMQVLGVGAAADLDQCGQGGRDVVVISDPWGSRVFGR